MKKLNSKKYPNIQYKNGEELFLSPDESGLTFWFDVEDGLTKDDEAMAMVAVALDEVENFEKTAKEFLKSVLSDENDQKYDVVSYFMEFHRDEIDPDAVAELFPVDDPSKLSFSEMVDYLRLNRFGSIIDGETGQQGFIMDLNFNPEITDELMVIYFNSNKQITDVAHES